MNFYLNDRPAEFELDNRELKFYPTKDRAIDFDLESRYLNFYLVGGVIEFVINATRPVMYRLLEDGGRRLTEDGHFRILE